MSYIYNQNYTICGNYKQYFNLENQSEKEE
jgi:hypothetical protein